MLNSQTLVDILLAPFEDAMRSIISFLDAKQIDVYLFDDDRFLVNELRTDGSIFIYNKQQGGMLQLSEAVNFTSQDLQDTSFKTPLFVEGSQIGHYCIHPKTKDDFDRNQWLRDVAFITPVAARIIEANHNRLQAKNVYIDDLTQIYNRRKLNDQMALLFEHFKTGQKKLFVAMLDIDKFKAVNEYYGYSSGDAILKQTALLIRDGVPYAYRYSGGMFCTVFYGHERHDVIDAIKDLRVLIQKTPFMISSQEHHITISAGIAELDHSMNAVKDVIDRAVKALYLSKEGGRNRYAYYDDVKQNFIIEASRLQ